MLPVCSTRIGTNQPGSHSSYVLAVLNEKWAIKWFIFAIQIKTREKFVNGFYLASDALEGSSSLVHIMHRFAMLVCTPRVISSIPVEWLSSRSRNIKTSETLLSSVSITISIQILMWQLQTCVWVIKLWLYYSVTSIIWNTALMESILKQTF